MSKSLTTTDGSPLGLAQMRRAPTHPGALLAETFAGLGLSAAEAARRMGISPAQLSHIQTGRRPMPHSVCVRLAALTGTSAESWATMQMRHDLWHAMHDKATAAAARRIASAAA